ncbi:TetR/AcrR family transcriptional regulator [Spongiactinospora rosea]|uniref:TetR/AcrR family transcriptional regulator n=1 Tax=Spongiactinospora rosea TaxID=2248750 RepID=A0A366M0J6_9ACTN|nr:TetR/AcrR family transcriptional regulator [Spongiactinospora rosea]RBQ19557.1 TetR/AcrR family transcriptional regulator [Spongiactinospora rosea]
MPEVALYDRPEPPRRDKERTRRRILDAAGPLFAEFGYEQVTMRMIAAAAEVNIALINRYFGAKRKLFAQVLAQQGRFPGVLDGPPDELPRRLAEYVADRLCSGAGSPVLTVLSRSSEAPEIHDLIRDRVESAMLEPLRARLPGPDARARASIATALIMGAGILRRLFGPDAAGGPDRDALADRLTLVFRAVLAA